MGGFFFVSDLVQKEVLLPSSVRKVDRSFKALLLWSRYQDTRLLPDFRAQKKGPRMRPFFSSFDIAISAYVVSQSKRIGSFGPYACEHSRFSCLRQYSFSL